MTRRAAGASGWDATRRPTDRRGTPRSARRAAGRGRRRVAPICRSRAPRPRTARAPRTSALGLWAAAPGRAVAPCPSLCALAPAPHAEDARRYDDRRTEVADHNLPKAGRVSSAPVDRGAWNIGPEVRWALVIPRGGDIGPPGEVHRGRRQVSVSAGRRSSAWLLVGATVHASSLRWRHHSADARLEVGTKDVDG